MKIPPNALLRLIRDKGLTPKAVAQDLGVNLNAVYAWATRGAVPERQTAQLAALLSVAPNDLGVLMSAPPSPKAPTPPKGADGRKARRGVVLHPERNAEMYRLREEGLTLQEIGARYGLSRESARLSILKHCRTANAHPPIMRESPRTAEAARLRQQGLAWRAIGRALGCAPRTARREAVAHADRAGVALELHPLHPKARPDMQRRAYEMRLTGTTWPAIGKALGIRCAPAQRAVTYARKHAHRHNLPWPPKVTR